jgi:hypothetical protein
MTEKGASIFANGACEKTSIFVTKFARYEQYYGTFCSKRPAQGSDSRSAF